MSQPDGLGVAVPLNSSPFNGVMFAQAAAGTGAGIIATTTNKGKARDRKRASENTGDLPLAFRQHLSGSTLMQNASLRFK
jgi:hypothetical protein